MNAPVQLRRLPHAAGLPAPSYAHPGDSGADLRAAIEVPTILLPGQRKRVPIGFEIALPEGWEAQVRTRSGMAWNNGIVVANSPGTIDSGYRGEIVVILLNTSGDSFTITPGMRVAQMVVVPVTQASFAEVASLSETARGAGGFGSTGVA